VDLRLAIDLLGKSPLFGSLAEPDCAAIARRKRRIDFEPNQMIFSRGDPRREIYLVLDGRVRLRPWRHGFVYEQLKAPGQPVIARCACCSALHEPVVGTV
jgi:hypothetical protein